MDFEGNVFATIAAGARGPQCSRFDDVRRIRYQVWPGVLPRFAFEDTRRHRPTPVPRTMRCRRQSSIRRSQTTSKIAGSPALSTDEDVPQSGRSRSQLPMKRSASHHG